MVRIILDDLLELLDVQGPARVYVRGAGAANPKKNLGPIIVSRNK